MEFRRFLVRGGRGTDVIGVGLRPSLLYHGIAIYNLKVVVRNIRGGKGGGADAVEAIVMGPRADVRRFYDFVKGHDIRQIRKGPRPRVSALEEYDGPEPNWDYGITVTNSEQIYKGFGEIASMRSDMSDMRKDMSGIRSDMSDMRKDMSGMRKDMSGIRSDLSEIKASLKKLDALAEMQASLKKLEGLADMKDAVLEFLREIREGDGSPRGRKGWGAEYT